MNRRFIDTVRGNLRREDSDAGSELLYIAELENHLNLDKWLVEDVNLWSLVRVPLTTCWSRNDKNHRKSPSLRILKKIYVKLRSEQHKLKKRLEGSFLSLNDEDSRKRISIAHLLEGKEKFDWISQESSGVFVNFEDKGWFSKFSSPLLPFTRLSKRLLSITDREMESFLPNQQIFAIKDFELLDIEHSKLLKELPDFVSLQREIAVAWCKEKGLQPAGLEEKSICARYNRLQKLRAQMGETIRELEIKLALVVCWYRVEGMALALAAHDNNIPSVDLQHGLAGGSFHCDYCHRKFGKKGGREEIPDYFVSWAPEDSQAVAKWHPRGAGSAIACGNLFNQYVLSKRKSAEGYDGRLRERARSPTILVILQLKLHPVVRDLVVKLSQEFVVVLRPHPVFKTDFDGTFDLLHSIDNVVMDDPHSNLLVDRMLDANVVVTAFSSAAIEALDFGVPVVFYHSQALMYFRRFIDSGKMYLETDAESLCERVRSLWTEMDQQKEVKRRKSFDCEGLNRAVRFLEKIEAAGTGRSDLKVCEK